MFFLKKETELDLNKQSKKPNENSLELETLIKLENKILNGIS